MCDDVIVHSCAPASWPSWVRDGGLIVRAPVALGSNHGPIGIIVCTSAWPLFAGAREGVESAWPALDARMCSGAPDGGGDLSQSLPRTGSLVVRGLPQWATVRSLVFICCSVQFGLVLVTAS